MPACMLGQMKNINTPKKIAANAVTIGTNLEPPKKPKYGGNTTL
ncbi:Uncharacterised protein [Staphylococcus aureus]|nr:Uncharacterised protein [Staphylococcus aureus]